MGMSYLTSWNTQLFKNIAYVGSFGHYPVQISFTCFCSLVFFPLITHVEGPQCIWTNPQIHPGNARILGTFGHATPPSYEAVFYVDVGLDWGCASELSNPRIDGTWENAK